MMIRTEVTRDKIAGMQDRYKYLGILQANGNKDEVSRSTPTRSGGSNGCSEASLMVGIRYKSHQSSDIELEW